MGLRSKITLALLALALIPLAITTAVVSYLNLDRLKLSTKEYRLATADVVVSEVDNLLNRARSELELVGVALSQTSQPVADRFKQAGVALKNNTFAREIGIYGPDGVRVDSLRIKEDEPGPKMPDTLDQALRGVARTEKIAYLTVELGQGSHLPMIVPMYKGKGAEVSIYGYLWSAINLATFNEAASRVSKRRFGQKGDRVFILDDRFTMVVHGDHRQLGKQVKSVGITAGLEGGSLPRSVAYAEDYDLAGESMLGVLVPIPSVGWGVVVEQPRAEAYRAVRTTLTTAAVVGIAFAVLALLIGLFMGQRLAAPVISVAGAARKVAEGDFTVRVEARGSDEVGDMGRSFNTMAEGLGNYRDQVVKETRIRTDLSRYLTAELVEQIVDEKASLELGGKRQRVTIMFADVVSFTPMAEKYPPEFVVGILNELFTFLTEIVFKHGGVVDKFIGDCVMAVFGAPEPHDDDELRAVRVAEEMNHWLEVGNAKWRKDLGKDLQLAIGINTGDAVVGNIGSKKRMEYTVIGDAVNVAARLEAIARPGQVLMTAETMEKVKDEFECESIGERKLSGKGEPMEIFALKE